MSYLRTEEIRTIIEDWHNYYYPKCRYTKNDAQSIPDTTITKIEYDDVDYDTLSNYDTTNFGFTVPHDGYYNVNAGLMTESVAWTAGQYGIIYIYKDDSSVSQYLEEIDANVTKYLNLPISDTIKASKGELINIRFWHNKGSSTNTYTVQQYNHFSVHRV